MRTKKKASRKFGWKMNESNPRKMLTQLRKREGLTQKEMAARLGVGQSLISQIERGERSLGDELVTAARKEFDLSRTYFTDRRPVGYDRRSLNYRRQKLPAKTQDRLLYQFGETEQDIQATDLPIPTVELRFPRPTGGERLSVEEIEAAASHARKTLRLPPQGPIPNVIRAVEAAGIVVTPLEMNGVDLSKFDGVSSPEKPDRGPLVIGYAPQESGDRQRFTIAHELGHLVLHLVERPDSEAVREDEAHQFAGAFLYPANDAEQEITPALSLSEFARIKAHHGISIQAIIRRARDLELITSDRYTSLMMQISHRGWRLKEPVPVGLESTKLIEMIQEHELEKTVVPLHQWREQNR